MTTFYKNAITRRKFIDFFSTIIFISIFFFKTHRIFKIKKDIIISEEGWILSKEDYDI